MYTVYCRTLFIFFFSLTFLSANAGTIQAETIEAPEKIAIPSAVQPPPPPAANPMQTAVVPTITKMEDGRVALGNIIIDKKQDTVSVQGVINMEEGMVEYLACTSYGKLHESVLQLDVDPYYLQIAMLLIGLEPGSNPISHQGAKEIPKGDPVNLWVSWQGTDNTVIKHRAEELLYNKALDKSIEQVNWVFTGSLFDQNRFLAQVEGSIVAVYHDPMALLDNTMADGSNDELFFVNTELVPPKGSPITFIVQKTSRPDEHKEK